MCFAVYAKLKKIIGDAPKQSLEHFYLYNLRINGIPFNLYISKKRATKATVISCTDGGDLIREQLYPFGGMARPSREKKYVLKPAFSKGSFTAVIIRGKPGSIIGQDNGVFTSDLSKSVDGRIYIASEADAVGFISSV